MKIGLVRNFGVFLPVRNKFRSIHEMKDGVRQTLKRNWKFRYGLCQIALY